MHVPTVAAAGCAALACTSVASASITFVQTFDLISDNSTLTISSPLRGAEPVPIFNVAGTVDFEITFNGTIIENARVVDFSIGFADNPVVLDLGVFGTATLENVNASMEQAGDADYFSKGDADNGEFDDGFISQTDNTAALSGTATVPQGLGLGAGVETFDLASVGPEFRAFDIDANIRKPFNTDEYQVEGSFQTPVFNLNVNGINLPLQINGFVETKAAPLIPAAPTALALLAGVIASPRRR